MPARKISKSRKHSKGSGKRHRASIRRSKKLQRGGAYSYSYSSNGLEGWKTAHLYQAKAIEDLLASKQAEYYYNDRDTKFTLIQLQKRIDNSDQGAFEINFIFIRENGSVGYLRRIGTTGMTNERIEKWTM